MKLLLTAFEPFGGEDLNSAKLAMDLLPERAGQVCIVKLTVPTVFETSGAVLLRALSEHSPDAVLCLGQAAGRRCLTPERIAVNIDDARIPDNAGTRPVDSPIVPGGPAAYFATLPVKAMVRAINASGVPAELSNSAGTFVCNHLMYVLLNALSGTGIPGGFMHVPLTREQAEGRDLPGLELRIIARGVLAAVEAIGESLS